MDDDASPARVFGPIPSRRLGRSVGINHIPPKTCTYSCVYCQVGRTSELSLERRTFYGTDPIVGEVEALLERARRAGERVDHLTFVPDGEPTLDADLGATIERLAATGVPVAVITNGSLLWRPDVRADLAGAAWVSVKVDAVEPEVWRRTNRPARALSLDRVLDGIQVFARSFTGVLATETLLVRGLSDTPEHLRALAGFLGLLQPAVAYVSTPTRPPAEPWVEPPTADALTLAHQLLAERVGRVELLVEHGGGAFASLGDAARDLVATAAVHPMEREAVLALLASRGLSVDVLEDLLSRGALVEARHAGRLFYVAGWQRRASRGT